MDKQGLVHLHGDGLKGLVWYMLCYISINRPCLQQDCSLCGQTALPPHIFWHQNWRPASNNMSTFPKTDNLTVAHTSCSRWPGVWRWTPTISLLHATISFTCRVYVGQPFSPSVALQNNCGYFCLSTWRDKMSHNLLRRAHQIFQYLEEHKHVFWQSSLILSSKLRRLVLAVFSLTLKTVRNDVRQSNQESNLSSTFQQINARL